MKYAAPTSTGLATKGEFLKDLKPNLPPGYLPWSKIVTAQSFSINLCAADIPEMPEPITATFAGTYLFNLDQVLEASKIP